MRNKDPQKPITAKVVLFSHDGKQEATSRLDVAANSVGRLRLDDIVKAQGDSVHWGSVKLEFSDTSHRTISQVIIENEKEGLIFDLEVLGGYRYDTDNALYAPWWLPDDKTEATAVLSNSTEDSIVVTPSIVADGREQVIRALTLAPHETQKLGLREFLPSGLSAGSVVLRYTGQAHALMPALLLLNSNTGFSLAPDFNAKRQGERKDQTTWRYPAVFLSPDSKLGFKESERLTAYALLTNGTNALMPLQLLAHISSDTGPTQNVTLPVKPLQPLETRLVNLSDFAASESISSGVSHFALDAGHSGTPGDLGLVIFSLGESMDFVLKSEGSVQASQLVDSSYWDISQSLVALVTAQNTTDVSVQARAKLSYETSRGAGTYTLPPIDVPARGSRVLNLKQIILSGTPDENGNVIPPGTTFGTMALEVVNKTSRGLVFGGSTTFDPVKGGYGEFIFPDCSICTFCEDCVVDGYGNSTCQPSCSDPSCCPTPDPSPTLSSITPNHVAIGTTSLNVTLKGSFSSNPHIVIGDSSGQPTSVITVGNLQAPDPQTITATFAITSSATLGTYGVAVQDDGGQSGTIGFSLVPRIDSISPSRGPIGATTAVTISGAGFGTGPTVNAGSGITVTINSASDTQIQASFAISASAAGGNGPVTLTASGQTSDSINFFVQIPTSLSIVAGTSSTTPEASCTTTVAGQPATGCGVTRSFTYQVNDQDTPAQPIEAAGLQVWDAISVTSPNNLGISGVATTCTGTAAGTNNGPCNVTTNSLGQFEETPGLSVCSTVCRVNNACTTGGPTNANQTVHVGPSTITQSPSYYCDHITVNGQ